VTLEGPRGPPWREAEAGTVTCEHNVRFATERTPAQRRCADAEKLTKAPPRTAHDLGAKSGNCPATQVIDRKKWAMGVISRLISRRSFHARLMAYFASGFGTAPPGNGGGVEAVSATIFRIKSPLARKNAPKMDLSRRTVPLVVSAISSATALRGGCSSVSLRKQENFRTRRGAGSFGVVHVHPVHNGLNGLCVWHFPSGP